VLNITHLFGEMDVILQPGWLRAGIIDLILTKMARADQQDLKDIRFPLSQQAVSRQKLLEAFARARVPDVGEIRHLFLAAQPKVLKLAGEYSK